MYMYMYMYMYKGYSSKDTCISLNRLSALQRFKI